MLCDVPVHTLAAAGKRLLQSSRNAGGHSVLSVAHHQCRLRLKRGARHLLLGANGAGKTTLLRAIASGQLEEWPSEVTTHLVDGAELSTRLAEGGSTALEVVLSADKRSRELLLETEKEEDPDRLYEIYEELERRGADDEGRQSARASRILVGLGFRPDQVNARVRELSGGWQMRVALAAGLFAAPELLMLDEPTNHLDLPTLSWLERHLVRDFHGTLLIVSHDRAFVEEVATEVVALADQSISHFSGTLLDFERTALARKRNTDRQTEALQRKRDHLAAAAKNIEESAARTERNRCANGENNRYAPKDGERGNSSRKSKQVSNKLRQLDRAGLGKTADGTRVGAKQWNGQAVKAHLLGSVDENEGGWVDGRMTAAPPLRHSDPQFQFCFPAPGSNLGVPEDAAVLELRGADFAYEGAAKVLQGVNLAVCPQSRIAVTGGNGAGKSTLAKLLAGELAPEGEVRRHRGLQVAYFGQHCAECLAGLEVSAVQHMRFCLPRTRDEALEMQLEAFGIGEGLRDLRLASLSAGQRVRVALAVLCAEEPHVLVLDEPTNHLDIYSIDALTRALQAFQGAVVLVTHDRRLLQQVAQRVVVVASGGVMDDETLDHAGMRFLPPRASC